MYKGVLTDGEPELKRPKVKLRAVVKPETEIWMPLQVWWNLILKPRLSLVELIQMRRVCRSFATYADLKALITLKQTSAFGGIAERHWNRMAPMIKSPPMADATWYDFRHVLVDDPFFEKHNGKLMFLTHYPGRKVKDGRFVLGVFSSRDRLLEAAQDALLGLPNGHVFSEIEEGPAEKWYYWERRAPTAFSDQDYYFYVPGCIYSELYDLAEEQGRINA